MTARDHFKLKFKCLKCDCVGEAHVSQEDGYSYAFGDKSTRLEKPPEGFTVTEAADALYNFSVVCDKCGVRAALLTP